MKMNLLILGLIIALTGAWTYFADRQSNARGFTQEFSKEKVRDFDFKTLGGQHQALSHYKDRVILLHFWATWCAPCVEELPKLIELAAANPKKLTLLAIAVADKEKDIQRFLRKTDKTLPNNFIIGQDPDKTISKDLYGTLKLPESYIIAPDLTLFEKITGATNDWSSNHWKRIIHQLH